MAVYGTGLEMVVKNQVCQFLSGHRNTLQCGGVPSPGTPSREYISSSWPVNYALVAFNLKCLQTEIRIHLLST